MGGISLTTSMRSNLLSLQNISGQVDSTQNKLSTGKKVNSAIDNPSSYYTALSLNNRADDLNALLDSMGQAVSTIKAATTALESATEFLEQAKAVANQALETGPIPNQNIPIYIPQPSGIGDDEDVRNTGLFDGKTNTQAMINQLGADALAATACNQFYAPGTDKNGANFGQGNWYLPAIGELMEMVGFEVRGVTDGRGTSGSNGENAALIEESLSALKDKGIDADSLAYIYWSSSEGGINAFGWGCCNDGERFLTFKSGSGPVRSFNFLENKFNPTDLSSAPQIGDVMYSDLTYGSADDYDGSKTAVGVISWVSEDGKSAKIISLKDLTFSSNDTVGNFDPDNPYGGPENTCIISVTSRLSEEIAGLDGIHQDDLLAIFQEIAARGDENNFQISEYDSSQYTSILSQHDALIKDAGYKGVNLLQEQNLKVTFNENRSSLLEIMGKDASSQTLGLVTLEWNNKEDVEKSIEEITNAINEIRSISSEFGNYYNIITTRQDFTENLINVLTEGADKLTLADMNEESANMLALQTRQQLAINSLSLASQASQSILKLF